MSLNISDAFILQFIFKEISGLLKLKLYLLNLTISWGKLVVTVLLSKILAF